MLLDRFGREISYLRLSVTDRCNLRCDYCSPTSEANLPRAAILSYEELIRVVALCVSLGLSKVRITGGEPLVRRDLVPFAARLASLEGLRTLALTTNGTLLAANARSLREAGVSRVNISLDTLDPQQFSEITGAAKLADVLAGIEATLDAGFEKVKINSVIARGVNYDQIVPLAMLAAERSLEVRFIEYMPLHSCGPQPGGMVASDEIVEVLSANFQLQKLRESEGESRGTVSARYRIRGHKGSIGLISPISNRFCSSCNRLRLLGLISRALNLKWEHHSLGDQAIHSERKRDARMRRIGG